MSGLDSVVQRISNDREGLSRAFRQIADFLHKEPRAFISSPMRALSERIGVSEPTLIRFARRYGYQGLPDLRLALAMSLATGDVSASAELEPRLTDKEVVNRSAKRAIANLGVELTTADRSLLLDSGSTILFLAERLVDAPGKVIMTTSLNAIMVLRNSPQHRLMMPGGEVRLNAMALASRMAETALAEMTFDTLFLGADTLHPEYGISTYSEEEAHLNRAMIRASKRVVALVDASKFKGPALHHICNLSDVDVIVSDTGLPADIRAAIEATTTQLILADPATVDRPTGDTV